MNFSTTFEFIEMHLYVCALSLPCNDVHELDVSQTNQITLQIFFTKMIFIILDSSYHANILLLQFILKGTMYNFNINVSISCIVPNVAIG